MVAASAVTATLTTIFMGTFSDRTRSKWGKCKPFILFGYLLWGLMTAVSPMKAMLIGPAIGSALIRRFGIPATLNGESGFIPVPVIFVVGAVISLFALIPWLFLKNQKRTSIDPVDLGADE